MSSSSVCQGLQSFLEPGIIEPCVVRLKLASGPCEFPSISRASPSHSETQEKPRTNTKHECDAKDTNSTMSGFGWSFLQSLAETAHRKKTEDPETEQVYVHPTVKRSSSMLSAKSLEMCTESLGCETGSNSGESSDEISLLSLENSACNFTRHTVEEANRNSVSKRLNKVCSFPPPLTSITDLGGVQVRPHREHGRLILEAVTFPSLHPCFEAERGNGRLRLRLFESFHSDSDDEVADDEGVGEEESNNELEEAETQNQEACGEEDSVAGEEPFENTEDETGMRKFARPSRCKESGNRDIFCDSSFELPLFLCVSE